MVETRKDIRYDNAEKRIGDLQEEESTFTLTPVPLPIAVKYKVALDCMNHTVQLMTVPHNLLSTLKYLKRIVFGTGQTSMKHYHRIGGKGSTLYSKVCLNSCVGTKLSEIINSLKKTPWLHFLACQLEKSIELYLHKVLLQFGLPTTSLEGMDWTIGFLMTVGKPTIQAPHCDFHRNDVVSKEINNTPYCVEFPLTKSGNLIEIWPNTTWAAIESRGTGEKLQSRVIEVAHGHAVAFRGDVVHAGGFKTSNSRYGNDRCHLYVYPKGTSREILLKTHHSTTNDKGDTVYFDEICIPGREDRLEG